MLQKTIDLFDAGAHHWNGKCQSGLAPAQSLTSRTDRLSAHG
jgi:hypothetical protein